MSKAYHSRRAARADYLATLAEAVSIFYRCKFVECETSTSIISERSNEMNFSKLLIAALVTSSMTSCIGYQAGPLTIVFNGPETQPYSLELYIGNFTVFSRTRLGINTDFSRLYTGSLNAQGTLTLTPLDASFQPVAGIKVYKLIGEPSLNVNTFLNISRDANGVFDVKCDGECQRIVLQP